MAFGLSLGTIVFIENSAILPLRGNAICYFVNYFITSLISLIYPFLHMILPG